MTPAPSVRHEFVSLVSIIIPAFNRPELLREALQSLVEQTYREWEAVVVDRDPSEAVRSVTQEFGPRVRYLAEETDGPGDARNRGHWRLRVPPRCLFFGAS